MAIRVQRITPDDKLYSKYLAVRYQVYCRERGFEDPRHHPNGLESDQYDPVSIHLAALDDTTGEVVGTARIVRDLGAGFPVEKHFDLHSPLPKDLDRQCIGEISRLAVPKQRCQEFQIISKLLDHIFLESASHGITHWYAAMAKGLPLLLKRRKINFRKAGPDVEFHGIRGPYCLDIQKMASGSPHFAYYDDGQSLDQDEAFSRLAEA